MDIIKIVIGIVLFGLVVETIMEKNLKLSVIIIRSTLLFLVIRFYVENVIGYHLP